MHACTNELTKGLRHSTCPSHPPIEGGDPTLHAGHIKTLNRRAAQLYNQCSLHRRLLALPMMGLALVANISLHVQVHSILMWFKIQLQFNCMHDSNFTHD